MNESERAHNRKIIRRITIPAVDLVQLCTNYIDLQSPMHRLHSARWFLGAGMRRVCDRRHTPRFSEILVQSRANPRLKCCGAGDTHAMTQARKTLVDPAQLTQRTLYGIGFARKLIGT